MSYDQFHLHQLIAKSSSIQPIAKTKKIGFVTLRVDHSIKYSKTMKLTTTTHSNCLSAKVDCTKLEIEGSKF